MMNIETLVKSRRTIHRFKATAVPDSFIKEAVSRVIYAPNHHATNPYRFYHLGPQTKTKLLDYARAVFMQKNPDSVEKRINRWQAIPGWLVATQKICADERQYEEDYATLSIALYIIMLALHEHHIGSKWSTASIFSTPEWYDLLAIDVTQERIIGILWFGYADKTPTIQPKPSMSDYFFERI